MTALDRIVASIEEPGLVAEALGELLADVPAPAARRPLPPLRKVPPAAAKPAAPTVRRTPVQLTRKLASAPGTLAGLKRPLPAARAPAYEAPEWRTHRRQQGVLPMEPGDEEIPW